MVYFNAKRLLFDAEILFKCDSFTSSAFLSISSIEESGKLYDVLYAYMKINKDEFDVKNFKKRFMNHYKKHLSSWTKAGSKVANTGNKISNNISKLIRMIAENKLMGTRNDCIYTDIDFEKLIIRNPQQMIKKDDAYYFLETAYEILISQIDSAFGDFWIDDSINIDFEALEKEKSLLTEKLKMLKKQYQHS